MGRQALVLAGHGSHYNPDSARPVFEHADRIRARDAFAEVREAFWKEEPSLREVLRTVESPEVFVVPAFVSEGYFVGEVLPRELGLDGADPSEPYGVYDLGDATVHYTEPFGTHDAMTDVVVQRAREAAGVLANEVRQGSSDERSESDGGRASADVSLAVVGHGTERNPHSAEAIHYHADRIRDRGAFGEVRALFMDEPPYVGDAADHFETDEIVAVPLFVADGFHTREEIPDLLGLASDGDGWRVPTEVGDHHVWYAGAVGTHPGVADAIVERAVDAGATPDSPPARPLVGERAATDAAGSVAYDARRAFLGWLVGGDTTTRTWGQLAITVRSDGRRYDIRHVEDEGADPASLDALADPRAVRERVRFDDEGAYRPLAGAPTLPTGWVCAGLGPRELVRAVEFVYPASVVHWHLEREGDLDPTSFRAMADRQKGIYDVVADLDHDELAAAVEACCADEVCTKRRAWDKREGEPVRAERGDSEVPCREPCSLFVAAVRAFVREERDGTGPDAPDPDVRVGNVDHEANDYRVRYRRARRRQDDERPTGRATAGGDPR